jgi:hypothetical protein
MTTSPAANLESRCDLLRSLHRPGAPLLLPNVARMPEGLPVAELAALGVARVSWGA